MHLGEQCAGEQQNRDDNTRPIHRVIILPIFSEASLYHSIRPKIPVAVAANLGDATGGCRTFVTNRGDLPVGAFPSRDYDSTMEMRSLLLSQDQQMIDVVQQALVDLGIGVEVYSTADWAREDLTDSRFDAVIIDCDVDGGTGLLKTIRGSASNGRALTFAIVNDDQSLNTAFELGANLALQKPISVDRARSSLRAAYGLIMQERRRYFRYPVDVAVRIRPNERTQLVANTINLSEGGMAIRCHDDLPLNSMVGVTFLLPGQKADLDSRGTVVWKDPRGHYGIRFEQLSVTNRQKLNEWLTEQATFL